MRTPHTSCYRGKRVVVTMRDGVRIRDIFEYRTDKFVILREHGRIAKQRIRAFKIDRQGTET